MSLFKYTGKSETDYCNPDDEKLPNFFRWRVLIYHAEE